MLLEISHVEDSHDPRYVVLLPNRVYTIGGGKTDIVLADSTVSPTHARLTLTETEVFIEDLRSDSGTFVDDDRIVAKTLLEIGQPIRVGETVLKVTLGEKLPVPNLWEAREPTQTETDILTALRANPADDAIRTVYADWLEGEGYRISAHYIRCELAGETDVDTDERLGMSITITNPDWRALIRRGPIGGCRLANCPRSWHKLKATSNLIRECLVCSKPVYFCANRDEIAARGREHARVVFDAGLTRQAAEVYYHGLYPDPDAYRVDYGAYSRLFDVPTGRWQAVDDDEDDD